MNSAPSVRRDWLSRRVAALDLTPEQFALRYDVQTRALLRWISGRSKPGPVDVHRLATAFSCEVVELEDEFAREYWIGKRGKWLAAVRRRQCLSQEDLAELLGVSSQRVSSWERNRSIPRLRNRRRIAEALQVPIAEIVAAYAQPSD